jgi:hypothetical protein
LTYTGSYAFQFTIAGNCPIGTALPFTLTFTDSWDNVWTDTFTIPVVKTGANIVLNTPLINNYKIQEVSGTINNKANPGETLYLDARIKNTGTSKALGLKAELSTTSGYVTIVKGSMTDLSDINPEYYRILTRAGYGTGDSSIGTDYFLQESNLSKAFRFTVSSSCPVDIELPLIITFTDSWGNSWTDTLSIPVE